MRIVRTSVACALALSLTTSAFAAGDLRAGVAQAAAAAADAAQNPRPVPAAPSGRTSGGSLVYTGGAVFGAGMATALYGFMRAGNGQYSTFGEATSRNKPLGAAGIAAAFTGGVLMFVGSKAARFAPSQVAVNDSGLSVEKTVSW